MKFKYLLTMIVGMFFLIQGIGAEPFIQSPLGFDSSLEASEFLSPVLHSGTPYFPIAAEPSDDVDTSTLEDFDKPTQLVEFASSFGPIKPYTNYPNVLNPLQAGFLPF